MQDLLRHLSVPRVFQKICLTFLQKPKLPSCLLRRTTASLSPGSRRVRYESTSFSERHLMEAVHNEHAFDVAEF